jgi:hypothetical protein
VRFVSDIIPAKVVTASRGEAIVKLLKIRAGRPDERSFDGEVLLYYYPTETVAEPITGQAASGVWRMSGGAGLNGIVYNGFNFVNLSRL